MKAGRRILVVEDDDDIRDVIKLVLECEGFGVEVAKDGLDALDKLEASQPPPVMLVDMMMPRMDGEAFISAVRSNPSLAAAPVVIISGNAVARAKADRLRASACLVKPFDADELVGVVRRLVGGAP